MAKFARIYFFQGERVEGQMPDTVFIGDVHTKRDNPSDPRKYLFLRKSGGKDANGEWIDIKATKIVWSDGTSTDISDKVITMKLTEQGDQASYPPKAQSGSGQGGSKAQPDATDFIDDLT